MTRVFTDVEKAYMRNEGCPFCQSELDYEDPELIDGELFRNSYCTNPNCNAEFQETWSISDVTVECQPFTR